MTRDWLFCISLLPGWVSGCVSPAVKPSASVDTTPSASSGVPVVTREDAVEIYVHEVRASHKPQYDSVMGEIWGTALRKAAATKSYWRQTLRAARDFVPAANTTDTSYTYVYLVAPATNEEMPATEAGFPKALLLDAGYSDRAADSLSKRFKALVSRSRGHFLVERKF